MVPTVSTANSGPSLVPRMYDTKAISNAVGATLNTIEFKMNWIPRVPRSMVRVTAPVCRDMCHCKSRLCRWSKTRSATPRIDACATLEKTEFWSSLHKLAPARATPYPPSMVAGVKPMTAAGRAAIASGPVAAPAPAIANASTAYLNMNGVPTLRHFDATRSETAPTTRVRCSGLSLGQMYGRRVLKILRSMSFSVSATACLAAAAALGETAGGLESSPPFPAAARSARDFVDSPRMSPNLVGERHAGGREGRPWGCKTRCSCRYGRVAPPCGVAPDAKPPNPRVHPRDAPSASGPTKRAPDRMIPRALPTSPAPAGTDAAGSKARDASDPTRRSARDDEDIAWEPCPAAYLRRQSVLTVSGFPPCTRQLAATA